LQSARQVGRAQGLLGVVDCHLQRALRVTSTKRRWRVAAV
jgi:hypothetical protein